ncbi:hypothetical protein [Altererythrobacter lutimaris]|uniref:Uncharacterized protein n=1 Tax=Altererythrobacter lutimaris TaxID=2743979 RepID=A0A850H9I2_9SPHN|nr:hypothetical protein [Altererythrobacter lutimaris]NVE95984.1 hypothetical protein [Altererythrobacter lutimaris]
MSFEPLVWLIGTLTPWHFVIWFSLAGIPAVVIPLATSQKPKLSVLVQVLWILGCLYGLFGLMLGQLYGDKYGFLEVLPTGFLFGLAFMLTPLFGLLSLSRTSNDGLDGCFVAASPIGGMFFGSCTWVFPRIIGFGLIDFPRYSWAVQT